MPYKSEKIKISGGQYDKRVKLTPEDREEIKRLHTNKIESINGISRIFGVSKRLIQFVLFPERLAQSRVNRDWTKYHDREKLTKAVRELRRRKQRLFLDKKIS